ncbi:heme o synthase [Cohaesibacter gelatinilyticus]|uniref:Protoheme IX farnesyltransferase n=1 Tax=Cohaesibacter gelatinilyticus TaxID=372072 RepID=A0A285N7K3_9HYPH|nr:heme o synthase [Cohaesibacter gelatinilyticus]SNZ05455.1 protoheme IX farnesyltransferase [Cohaesibacter gelatinilyticus]
MSVVEQTSQARSLSDAEFGSADVRDYIALLKPRVMSLVVFTAFVGLVVAMTMQPGTIHPLEGIIAILCIAIGGGASGALNMWYDADIDRIMKRTATRPIPAGKITPDQALAFGLILSIASVLVLGVLVNWLAAGLLAFTIFFYAVVYTMWLKRSTPQNIVIGGAAGAFPPMIGWAAVTGTVTIESIVLFLIIFMWTPPHFWALALLKSDDYKNAGVPMLPVVAGEDVTRSQILLYSLVVVPLGVTPALLGFAGMSYAALSSVLGLVFLIAAYRVYHLREGAPARKAAGQMFGFSILYLFALYATLLAEHLMGLEMLPSVFG